MCLKEAVVGFVYGRREEFCVEMVEETSER